MHSPTDNTSNNRKLRPALLGLPLIIFRAILEQLYQDGQAALLSLRLASRTCLHECDQLFYRSITLRDQLYEKRTQILVKRILDVEDCIATQVRHLIIGPFHDEEYFRYQVFPNLKQLVSAMTGLRSMSWNTSILIQRGLLDIFHHTHPTAQLHIISLKRDGKRLDRILLSSPQLHSLDINIYCKRPYRLDGTGITELQLLKQYLMDGNSLKILRFGFENMDPRLLNDDTVKTNMSKWDDGPLNFHWQDGDHFPALEEFSLRGAVEYEFSADQCEAWVRCMDWSRLRKLDLGQRITSLYLFQLLTGKVAQLKSLSATVSNWVSPEENVDHHLPLFLDFLHAINGLEEIQLQCRRLREILPTLLSQHGHSLVHMNLNRIGAMHNWSEEDFLEVLRKAPKLAYLRVYESPPGGNETDVEGKWSGSEVKWPPQEKYCHIKEKKFTAFVPGSEIIFSNGEKMDTKAIASSRMRPDTTGYYGSAAHRESSLYYARLNPRGD